MLQTILIWPTLLVRMSLTLCLSSGLPLLLGLFFHVFSQTLANPYSSSSLSFDLLPPLSSSITHDQKLPSCSFVTPKILPPVSTSLTPCSTLFPRKPRGGHPVRGKSSRGHPSRGKSPRARGRDSMTLSGHSPHSSSGSHNFSFLHTPPIFSQRYLSGDGALDLSTRPRVCSYLPQNPTINPFLITYSCSPKIFSPIVFFNKPSEYVFNMFSFIYTYNFSLVRTTDHYWSLPLNSKFFYSIYIHYF